MTSTKVKYRDDAAAFATFYGQAANKGEIWKPTSEDQNPLSNGDMFQYLVLVGVITIYAAANPRTPAELRKYAEALVADDTNILEADDLKLLLDWCPMACQRKPNTNNSLLSLVFRPAAHRDQAFTKWKQEVLRRAMGIGVAQPLTPQAMSPMAGGLAPQQLTPVQLLQLVSAQMGKSVSEALKPVAAAATRPLQRVAEKGQNYSAAIMGWSNVTAFSKTSKIWQEFAKEKSVRQNRLTLMAHMEKWGEKMNIEVDTTVYFGDEMMKQIIALSMIVGGHGPQYEYCEVGNSFLACMAEDKGEKAARMQKDQARSNTVGTRTYHEELDLGKAEPRHLPNTYEEAKLSAGTFTAL